MLTYAIAEDTNGIQPNDPSVFHKGMEVDVQNKFHEVFGNIGYAYALHELENTTGIAGGGTRGRGSASLSLKDECVKSLEEEIGISIMRIRTSPGASPAIDSVVNTHTLLMVHAQDENFKTADILKTIDMNGLKSILSISSSSSKHMLTARVCNIFFMNIITRVHEVERQLTLAYQALNMGVTYYFIKKFNDDSGNIL